MTSDMGIINKSKNRIKKARQNISRRSWSSVKKSGRYIVGIDEVGRGPVAGPVTVCAFCVDTHICKVSNLINMISRQSNVRCFDSKSVSPDKRQYIAKLLYELQKDESKGLYFSIKSKPAKHIDQKGISRCISELINLNLRQLNKKISADIFDTVVLLDGGLKAPAKYIYQQTIIKGDTIEPVIGFASILAKVYRDGYMKKNSKKYPRYDLEVHKGYGTKKHLDIIKKHGLCVEHRRSFLTGYL